jgi:hypothetical protein
MVKMLSYILSEKVFDKGLSVRMTFILFGMHIIIVVRVSLMIYVFIVPGPFLF